MSNTECADVPDGNQQVMILAFFAHPEKRFMLNLSRSIFINAHVGIAASAKLGQKQA